MRTRATLAAASLAVGVLALGVPTASAAQSTAADSPKLKKCTHWVLRGNHTDLGEACYFSPNHRAHVDDQEKNGHSVVLVISKKNHGHAKPCWDHQGHEGSGTDCTITKYGDDVRVRGRLCPGEYGTRKIHWKKCTKYKHFRM